ncbi:MAG: NUDIX hydrolase [Bacteroidota bacterium]
MARQDLLETIKLYSPEYPEEKEFRANFLSFVEEHTDCCERSLLIGHVTGSAWIIDETKQHALLTHHRKLDRWLQLGGHADGDTDIRRVALKEAEEESGLASIHLNSDQIFDIDIHTIPARKTEPEHLHYDIRYLLTADRNEPLSVSNESKDLAWVPIREIPALVDHEQSVTRMVEKTLVLK